MICWDRCQTTIVSWVFKMRQVSVYLLRSNCINLFWDWSLEEAMSSKRWSDTGISPQTSWTNYITPGRSPRPRWFLAWRQSILVVFLRKICWDQVATIASLKGICFRDPVSGLAPLEGKRLLLHSRCCCACENLPARDRSTLLLPKYLSCPADTVDGVEKSWDWVADWAKAAFLQIK